MAVLKSSDLFVKSWKSLDINDAWRVSYFLDAIADQITNGIYTSYGYTMKALLRVASLPKHRKTIKSLSDEQKVDLYNDHSLFFHQPFTHFYTPTIKAKSIVLHAPEEDLSNITYGHFAYIDAAFSLMLLAQYHKDSTLGDATDKFIATLYKPIDSRFDRQMVQDYLPDIKVSEYQKVLIIKAYANIRVNIIDRCPHLFPATESKTTTEPTYTGDMWRSLHFDMAETKAFQGYDTTEHANLYDALDYLENKAKEAYHKKSQS